MKNVKYLGLIGLGCATLLLTGCGGGSSTSQTGSGGSSGIVPTKNILTCTLIGEDPGESQIFRDEIEFNKKNNEIIGIKSYIIFEPTEHISDDEVEELKDYVKDLECDRSYIKECNVSFENNTVEVEAIISPTDYYESVHMSKEEVINLYKEHNKRYTCK